MKTLTAVLFVGGESRRMGKDKATLTLNGEPLWSRQIRILRELQPTRVLISARSTPDWRPDEIEVVLDQPPSRGPLSGLTAAFGKMQTTHLLALAVDLPKITGPHLERLWALAQPGIAVIPQNEESIEPLCAIYPMESASLARDTLSKEDVSLGGFVRTLATQHRTCFYEVTPSESPLYQNSNTPEEWKRAFA